MRFACVVVLFASAHGSLDEYLEGLEGESDVDCGDVCSSVDKQYQGMGMSSEGEVATWTCTCSGDEVVVACTGSPFIECCMDKCAGSDCPDEPAGWECPEDGGCPGGDCAGDWQDWVAAHNIYRCMHDVPPVVWSVPVFENLNDHFENQAEMEHSKCYDVAPPAGPEGENLFQGTGSYNAMDAVSAWYSEIENCGSMPGCDEGKTGTIGHFTALIWNGDKEIGCLGNKHNLFACRYKALDYLSCNTPNYGGDKSYPQNVFERKNSYESCVAKVKDCGLPVADPKDEGALDETTGLSISLPKVAIPSPLASFVPVAVASLMVGALVLGVIVMRRVQASQHGSETDGMSLVEGECSE